MHVLAMRIDVHIPSAQSLKERRAVVRPIIDGVRNRFSVSIAEVDHQDTWQRAAFGVAAVSGTASVVRDLIDDVERFIWSFPELEVTEVTRTWLEES